jgi:hypothetical protein
MKEQQTLGAAIAAVIRSEAAAQKMNTPADLARESGVPYPTLYRYWNDDREFPVSIVEQIAPALGKSVLWIVAEAERRRGHHTALIDHIKALGGDERDVTDSLRAVAGDQGEPESTVDPPGEARPKRRRGRRAQ